VFSPNGDGFNDEFYIDFHGATPMAMKIYNRWGELVRDLEGASILKWDGRNNHGKEVTPGVYYYICHFISETDQNQTMTGFVHLVK
jgi:gliding motility-associated-like protein